MASSDLTKASMLEQILKALLFLIKPENAVVYGPEAFKKLEDDKLLQAEKKHSFIWS